MEWLIAGILATIGALGGTINQALNQQQQNQQLLQEQQNLLKENQNELDLMQLQFDEATKEADKKAEEMEITADRKAAQAELEDAAQNINERKVSQDFNLGIEEVQNQQLIDAYGWQAQSMNADAHKGNELTQLAASGVRAGSSMAQAVEMEAALNSQQLQATQDATRTKETNAIMGLINGLASSNLGIQQGRIEADWLRNDADYLRSNASNLRASYREGGGQWNIYQQKVWNQNESTLMKWNNLQSQLLDLNDPGKNFLRYATSILSGGGSGFTSGLNLGKNINNSTNKNK